MTKSQLTRWRGLKDLLRDAVEQGTHAIERVHLDTARRPFAVLKRIPPLSEPAQGIHQVHDTFVKLSYGNVRLATRALSGAADVAFDAVARTGEEHTTGERDSSE